MNNQKKRDQSVDDRITERKEDDETKRYFASVKNDVGSDSFGAEFLFVIAQQLDGLFVTTVAIRISNKLLIQASHDHQRRNEKILGEK